MNNAIEIKDLTRRYDGFVLDRVSFDLPSGCIMGLIGENGAGKSTTLSLLLGLIRRDGGQVKVLGQDPATAPARLREQIGVVLDESNLPETMNLRQIGRMMALVYKGWQQDTYVGYCRRFHLPDNKCIGEFSRGMKMKAAIAAALSHDSRLLVLDEATSGLDPVIRDEILDVFLNFIQDEEHSILISSHILSDLEKACDYITFLHQGRLVFSQSKDALEEQYGMVRCTHEQYDALPPQAVVGGRRSAFGWECLVRRDRVAMPCERASIEEIMLYFIKEK